MDDIPLEAILAQARRGDPVAFEELVRRYNGRLHGYFFRLTGSRDEADDLLQELFLRVVRTLERYLHDGHFEAWLFRIATNLVRDRARRVRANPLRQPGEGQAADGDAFAGYASAGDARDAASAPLERGEQAARLQVALDALPPGEREVVLLRYYTQMSFQEIADVMGTPLGTALARGHRGLARLRRILTVEQEP